MAVLPLNSSTKLDQEPNPFEQSFSGAAVDDKLKDKLKLPPVASITSPSPVMNNLTNNHANNTAVIGGGILPKEVTSQFTWDTLRTGPLSPSMLQGPANPEEYYASNMIHNKPNSQLGSTSYSARSSFSSSAADLQYHHHQPVKVEQEMFIQPTTTTTRQQKTRQQTRSRQTSASSNRKRSVSQPEEDDQSMDSNESATKGNRRRSSALTVDSTEEEDTEHSKKKTRTSSSKDPEDDEKRKNFLERNRIGKNLK
jgi:hypothetical protein